jgi:endopolyphosphatase
MLLNVCLRSREPKANPTPCDPGPPRQLQGRFLHITDLHPDPLYRVGGSVSSGCHRKRPKKEKQRAGYLGTPYGFVTPPFFASFTTFWKYHSELRCGGMVFEFNLFLPYSRDCDSPLTLTNYTLDYLEEHWVKHIDFVVCTSRLFHQMISIFDSDPSLPNHVPVYCLTLLHLVGDNRDW